MVCQLNESRYGVFDNGVNCVDRVEAIPVVVVFNFGCDLQVVALLLQVFETLLGVSEDVNKISEELLICTLPTVGCDVRYHTLHKSSELADIAT